MKNNFCINGPVKLSGKVIISGSKNAALPILFSSLLTEKKVQIYNIPKLKDIEIAIKLLNYLGVKTKIKQAIYINAKNINIFCTPYKLAKIIRASFWALGPLVARFGKGQIAFPGGCEIGSRPIDLHIFGLRKLGAKIKFKKNYIEAYVNGKLKGNHIILKKVSVGATVTIMNAATLAVGTTVIENAACEPEIVDTANFLKTIGANIKGAGTNIITIVGVNYLKGGKYTVISDRIETATFLVAAAISRGNIFCYKAQPNMLKNILIKLKEAGADIKIGLDWISLNMHGKRPKAISVKTEPYPGFPTDMQSQFTLLNMISIGTGMITETIFENRFMHVPELIKMGAIAKVKKNKIISYGINKLFGAKVFATDLRASVSLVLAGCIAEGTTIIDSIHHIDRGYESIEKKLIAIGADIKRIKKS